MKTLTINERNEIRRRPVKLGIQFFAEPAPEGAPAPAPAAPPAPASETPPVAPKTFTQEDVNKIISDRLSKAEEAFNKKLTDKLTEAEKLSKMKEDERAEYEKKQREDRLAHREADITRRELRAESIETLVSEGLPKELADTLNYTSADACKASLDAVKKAFTSAVKTAVDGKLRGNPPKIGDPGEPEGGVEAAFYGLNPDLKKQ